MSNPQTLKKELRKYASPERKSANEWFFKTNKGDYGHGDRFIGVSMPDVRNIAKQHSDVTLFEIEKLLTSKIHEERTLALVLLVGQFKKGDKEQKKKIYDFYIAHTQYINNWDLVDVSAPYIVGTYLLARPQEDRKILHKLAKSKNLWEQRIAIIATLAFITQKQFDDTFKISDILMLHKHDLIHKAVGWMLREIGKKDQPRLENWLLSKRKRPIMKRGDRAQSEEILSSAERTYKIMPRTMLRYAIEKFAKPKYQRYLKGTI